jgi:hypothetical protein
VVHDDSGPRLPKGERRAATSPPWPAAPSGSRIWVQWPPMGQQNQAAVEALVQELWGRMLELLGPKRTMAEVRDLSVRATRLLESHVVEALASRKLRIRNLPNLVPEGQGDEVRGVRIRGRAETWFDLFHPGSKLTTESAPVLGEDGRIHMVTVSRGTPARWRRAEDQDLRAEDLLDYIRAVAFAMDRNRKADELGDLADRITAILRSARAD